MVGRPLCTGAKRSTFRRRSSFQSVNQSIFICIRPKRIIEVLQDYTDRDQKRYTVTKTISTQQAYITAARLSDSTQCAEE